MIGRNPKLVSEIQGNCAGNHNVDYQTRGNSLAYSHGLIRWPYVAAHRAALEQQPSRDQAPATWPTRRSTPAGVPPGAVASATTPRGSLPALSAPSSSGCPSCFGPLFSGWMPLVVHSAGLLCAGGE